MKFKDCFPEPGRYDRQGFPEAIYGQGKTVKQIISISKDLLKGGGPVLVTRTDKKVFSAVKRVFKSAVFFELANIILVNPLKGRKVRAGGYVCVVTGGTSDIPVAEEAVVTIGAMGVEAKRVYDVGVAGIHRLFKYQKELKGAACIVVCAGMEGALASVVGGVVNCPVIGVPTSIGYGVSFKGVSALLSMLNSCAANVCAVNIDDGFGAGVIASLIEKRQ
jgi:pyridinium-3,5-biscarboxylic acid mononucleotide synthase